LAHPWSELVLIHIHPLMGKEMAKEFIHVLDPIRGNVIMPSIGYNTSKHVINPHIWMAM
jgi:hypothetical protein